MSKSIKIFFIGALCTTLIAAVGFLNTYNLESKLHSLESKCTNEKVEKAGKQGELDLSRYGTLVCDAAELSDLEELKGIQAQIVQTHNDVRSSKKWPYSIAVLVILFSSIPWAWYFLLRRVRELRDVIVGK
jgi:cell division protein FtsL